MVPRDDVKDGRHVAGRFQGVSDKGIDGWKCSHPAMTKRPAAVAMPAAGGQSVSQSVRTSRRPMGGVRAVGGASTSSIECHTASPSQRATDADGDDDDDDEESAMGITSSSSSAAITPPRCRCVGAERDQRLQMPRRRRRLQTTTSRERSGRRSSQSEVNASTIVFMAPIGLDDDRFYCDAAAISIVRVSIH